jgi:hypothetical protein
MAPVRSGGFDGWSCDEIVGRYCLRYDSPDDPMPPDTSEPAVVTDARRAAIEALRSAFSFLPGEFETAGPLVRYLVEDGRPGEAVPAGRLFRAVSGDPVWGPLLEGFALHATGETVAAEAAFDTALERMDSVRRDRIERIDWLLEPADRSAYRKLDRAGQRAFEALFWRMADPLYLTPGNEARSEHLARHVWSRILARGPVVAGMTSWGSDVEQLTVRFGTPATRTRILGRSGGDDAIVEHFDPRHLAYTPQALLTAGVPPAPLPGRPWELDRKRTRAGYAAQGLRFVGFLPHQVSRFPAQGGVRVRIDAEMADTVAEEGPPPSAAFWLLDARGIAVAERRRALDPGPDTVHFFFEADADPGLFTYAVEALDPAGSWAARARYSVDIDAAAAGPRISDPVILEPFRGRARPESRDDPAFRPLADLTVRRADTLAVYAEAAALTPGTFARLRLSLQPASRANLPARVLGWIGRRIGLSDPRDPVFVEWSEQAGTDGRLVLGFELPPQPVEDGDHVLITRVTDLATGRMAESRRIIRFASGS